MTLTPGRTTAPAASASSTAPRIAGAGHDPAAQGPGDAGPRVRGRGGRAGAAAPPRLLGLPSSRGSDHPPPPPRPPPPAPLWWPHTQCSLSRPPSPARPWATAHHTSIMIRAPSFVRWLTALYASAIRVQFTVQSCGILVLKKPPRTDGHVGSGHIVMITQQPLGRRFGWTARAKTFGDLTLR